MNTVNERSLTVNEAVRTAQTLPLKFRHVAEKDDSGRFKFRLQTKQEAIESRDKTYKMCRMCKNEDTDRLRSPWELKPFNEIYKDKPYRAYSCYCCGYKWSHEVTED